MSSSSMKANRDQVKPMQTGRFNVNKWRKLSLILGLTGFILLQHQNCAQVGAEQMLEQADEPLPVTVIDSSNTDSAVRFSNKSVEIHTDVQSVVLEGACPMEQDGAVFGWYVRDIETQGELNRGYAKCEGGRFQVEVTPTQLLKCGEAYRVGAQLGAGLASEISLSRRCAPELVVDASAMKATLSVRSPSQCVLEKTESDAGVGCSVVCYSAGGIVEAKTEADPASCATN